MSPAMQALTRLSGRLRQDYGVQATSLEGLVYAAIDVATQQSRQTNDRYRERIGQILLLHAPIDGDRGYTRCRVCGVNAPCETVRMLTGER